MDVAYDHDDVCPARGHDSPACAAEYDDVDEYDHDDDQYPAALAAADRAACARPLWWWRW